MKTLIFFLSVIIFNYSTAQVGTLSGPDSTHKRRENPMWAADHPPKGSNTIIISGVTFNEVSMKILDAGYFIDSRDTVLKIIKTAPRSDKYNDQCTFRIRQKDSVILVVGEFTRDFMGQNITSYIQKTGMNGSPYMVTWNLMDTFAHLLGDQISYAKL